MVGFQSRPSGTRTTTGGEQAGVRGPGGYRGKGGRGVGETKGETVSRALSEVSLTLSDGHDGSDAHGAGVDLLPRHSGGARRESEQQCRLVHRAFHGHHARIAALPHPVAGALRLLEVAVAQRRVGGDLAYGRHHRRRQPTPARGPGGGGRPRPGVVQRHPRCGHPHRHSASEPAQKIQ